ncbi:hypothetical protein HPB49_019076 [Dermacentor silvarum]|uniref:Uncharacterized protein n=1 Tax=Dermacentor silvarum TaxID=543639 RepID=A0ACB8C518_DERSI|nr:hypothetical protein HPB49_019076 [Dermacentor silvarum]
MCRPATLTRPSRRSSERAFGPFRSCLLRNNISRAPTAHLRTMPMIITGDFNVNLRNGQNQWLPNFMRDLFGMSLASESEVPTTRFGTALDHVFQGWLKNVEVLKYASYFSVHRPLLCLVANASDDEGCHGDTQCASGTSATVERDRASHPGVTGDEKASTSAHQ